MSTSFNSTWLTNPKYLGWLEKVKDKPCLAFCRPCHKEIALSNMGKRALDSHAKSKKHMKQFGMKREDDIASIKMFFQAKPCSSAGAAQSTPSTSGTLTTLSFKFSDEGHQNKKLNTELDDDGPIHDMHVPEPPPLNLVERDDGVNPMQVPPAPNAQQDTAPVLNKWLQSKETRKAEILWALKCVQSHLSFRSNDGVSELFQAMFWDSNIAKNYSCGRTKQSYLITFGIAPFFKDMLVDDIRKSDFYTVIFDESFNQLLQKEQMDILIRFWKADRVITRYLGSQFLSGGRAEDLLKALKAALVNLDPTRMVQLGMDGPNVNLKLQKMFIEDRKRTDPDVPDLIDIGTCSLHVVHGAMQTGICIVFCVY